jgi:hypothetical protein
MNEYLHRIQYTTGKAPFEKHSNDSENAAKKSSACFAFKKF